MTKGAVLLVVAVKNGRRRGWGEDPCPHPQKFQISIHNYTIYTATMHSVPLQPLASDIPTPRFH